MPDAIKKNDSRHSKAPVQKTADQVYQQMIPDFPATALQWVKTNSWIGPLHIDLDEIDFSNRANWTASREPKKVQMHQDLIEEDKSKPVILAQVPGNPKLVCIDAHHRLLAYEAMGKEPEAYVVNLRPADVEAALHCHSQQYSGGSKLNGT